MTDEQVTKTLTAMRDAIGYDAASFRMAGLGSETIDHKVIALQIALNALEELRDTREMLDEAAVIEFWGNAEIFQYNDSSGRWGQEQSAEVYASALAAWREGVQGEGK